MIDPDLARPLLEVGPELLGDDDRAVPAPGAAHGDGHGRLPLAGEPGQGEVEKAAELGPGRASSRARPGRTGARPALLPFRALRRST